MASIEAKVFYLKKNLGRNLEKEKAFPLLLIYNYHSVIKPRCEILKNKYQYFDLSEALPLTDDQFCLAFGCTKEELEQKKGEKGRT